MAARKPRPTSPRIPPVTEPTALQQELFDLQRVGSGGVGNIFATMAHNTRVFRHWSKLGGTLLFRGTVPAREREIVILRVGWNAQSVYEFGQHTVIGRNVGLTDDEIRLLCRPIDEGNVVRRRPRPRSRWPTSSVPTTASPTPPGPGWPPAGTRSSWWSWSVCAGFYRLVSGFLNSTGVPARRGRAFLAGAASFDGFRSGVPTGGGQRLSSAGCAGRLVHHGQHVVAVAVELGGADARDPGQLHQRAGRGRAISSRVASGKTT